MVLLLTRDDCIFRTNTFFSFFLSDQTQPDSSILFFASQDTRIAFRAPLSPYSLSLSLSFLLSLSPYSLSFFTFLSLHPPSQSPSFQLSTQLTNIPSLSSFQSLSSLSFKKKRDNKCSEKREEEKEEESEESRKGRKKKDKKEREREENSLSNDLAIKQRWPI